MLRISDWLTMELVLTVLLVPSFTCVGLVALWAATSPLHWFVRTAVFLIALAPLLFIPAYEPLITFVIQGSIVAVGVDAFRRSQNHRQRSNVRTSLADATTMPTFHFSLLTLLLLMALVALSTPIMTRLPRLNLRGWSSVVLIGAASGVATVLAGWMSASRRKLVAWPIIGRG